MDNVMADKNRKIKKRFEKTKKGCCDECQQRKEVSKYRKIYLCRNCLCGEYSEEYIRNRIEFAMLGSSGLARLEDNEIEGFGPAFWFRKGKRK